MRPGIPPSVTISTVHLFVEEADRKVLLLLLMLLRYIFWMRRLTPLKRTSNPEGYPQVIGILGCLHQHESKRISKGIMMPNGFGRLMQQGSP